MDLRKLTKAEQIIGAAAIAFIISTFLPWFSIEVTFFGQSASEAANGWDVGLLWGRFPALLALVMLVAVALDRLTDAKLPDLPVSYGQLHLGLGALVALLVALKLAIGEDGGASGAQAALLEEAGVGIERAWGLFIALIAALALAAGGFLKLNEERSGATSAPPAAF